MKSSISERLRSSLSNAAAALRNADILNGFAPFSSMKSPIVSNNLITCFYLLSSLSRLSFIEKTSLSEKRSYTLLPVCHSSFTFSERIGVSSTIILLIDDCCNGVCNCSIGRMFPMIIKTNKIIYTSKNPRIAPQTHLLALKPVFLQTYLTNYQVMKVQFL